jgi:hypothetical protein
MRMNAHRSDAGRVVRLNVIKPAEVGMNQGRVMTICVGISLLVSIGISFLANPLTPKAQEPKRYEYRIVEVLPDTMNMQTKLNEFGMSGWELVAVSMGNMTEPRLIFKR